MIDELTVSIIPVVLGEDVPLFAGVKRRHPLELIAPPPAESSALVQLRYRPKGR